jgi:hypothetical protein
LSLKSELPLPQGGFIIDEVEQKIQRRERISNNGHPMIKNASQFMGAIQSANGWKRLRRILDFFNEPATFGRVMPSRIVELGKCRGVKK